MGTLKTDIQEKQLILKTVESNTDEQASIIPVKTGVQENPKIKQNKQTQ
ncbi:MAG: hypothetical protein QXO71_09700 [Candidatus Jordarchaeaceae archaeon]